MSAIPPDRRPPQLVAQTGGTVRGHSREQHWSRLLRVFGLACKLGLISNQRYQPPLCIAVAVDVSLSGLD